MEGTLMLDTKGAARKRYDLHSRETKGPGLEPLTQRPVPMQGRAGRALLRLSFQGLGPQRSLERRNLGTTKVPQSQSGLHL